MWYCSVECQKVHWAEGGHKKQCKALQAGLSASGSARGTDAVGNSNSAMEPCEGNCVHGDKGYVDDPCAYDGTKCGCVKCPNFELCEVWAPPVDLSCSHSRCLNCDISFGKNLVICSNAEDCPICLEVKPVFVEHPAGCKHAVCIDCFKELWWPEAAQEEDFDWSGRAVAHVCALCRANARA